MTDLRVNLARRGNYPALLAPDGSDLGAVVRVLLHESDHYIDGANREGAEFDVVRVRSSTWSRMVLLSVPLNRPA